MYRRGTSASNERVSHDAILKMHHRLEPSLEPLWFIDKNQGSLIIDDSTLDKPYARVKQV